MASSRDLRVGEIVSFLIDLGFDCVEIGLDVLRFTHHRLGRAAVPSTNLKKV